MWRNSVSSENDFPCVYMLTSPNGKRYIGKTKHYTTRMKQHAYQKNKTKISHSIQKYGWDSFKKEVLVIANVEHLSQYEIKYIALYGTNTKDGLNLTDGGEGRVNSKCSQETRLKMSMAHKGKKRTAEQCKNIGDSLRGKKRGPEFSKNVSKGRHATAQLRSKVGHVERRTLKDGTVRFRAKISIKGQKYHVGVFSSEADATLAIKAFVKEKGGL